MVASPPSDDDASFVSACSSFTIRADGASEPDNNDVTVSEPAGFDAVCRLCFEGDAAALEAVLRREGTQHLHAYDCHGLSPLHIAAMRNNAACAEVLLAAGAKLKHPSQNGWYAYEEAQNHGSRLALRVLLDAHKAQFQRTVRERLKRLGTVLSDMPDCAFQVSWELTSPVLGAVLHKHLPRDTYTVYKRGCRLRVDGHMKGMHEDGNTLLPCWKYGHFSILVDTDPQSAVQPLYVSHDKQQYTVVDDLDEADDGANAGADSNAHLNRSQEVKRSRVKFSKFQLAPVRGWVSGDLHEKVNGFPCTVYEAHGELMAVTTIKVALRLPMGATFEEYHARPRVPDVQAVVPLNFSSGFSDKAADGAAAKASKDASAAASATPRGEAGPAVARISNGAVTSERAGGVSRRSWSSRKRSSSGAHAQAAPPVRAKPAGELLTLPTGAYVQRTTAEGTGRRVKARMWLARDVAINQRQLLPLLDIMSTQNKYIGKVSKFMETYGDLDLFPVRVVVPLMLSMRVSVNIKNICVWGAKDKTARATCAKAPAEMREPPPAEFFEPPPWYRKLTWEEAASQKQARHDKHKAHKEGVPRPQS